MMCIKLTVLKFSATKAQQAKNTQNGFEYELPDEPDDSSTPDSSENDSSSKTDSSSPDKPKSALGDVNGVKPIE